MSGKADLSLSSSRWADEVDDDDEYFPLSPITPIPSPIPTPSPGGSGKKTKKEKKRELRESKEALAKEPVLGVAGEDERVEIVVKVDPTTGRRTKIYRTFRLEKQMVSQDVIGRKKWAKFGQSKNDSRGPNAYTTVVADDVQMQFLVIDDAGVEQVVGDPSDVAGQLKGKGFVKCRFCQGEHFSAKCPFKDSATGGDDVFLDGKKDSEEKPGIFVPPAMRGGNRRGETMEKSEHQQRRDDATIRISNLPETMSDTDIQELCGPFGRTERIFLAKDRTTGICKGFAFITYQHREDAERAVTSLDGYGYDHLILGVSMSTKKGE